MAIIGGKKQQPSSGSNGPVPSEGSKKSQARKQETLPSPQSDKPLKILTAEGWKRRLIKKRLEQKS